MQTRLALGLALSLSGFCACGGHGNSNTGTTTGTGGTGAVTGTGGGSGSGAAGGTGGSSDAGATGGTGGGDGGMSDAGPAGCAPAPSSSMVVDVTQMPYGAKGDGKADDTAAIQNAINAVGGTGGTVLIPSGTYMIDAGKALLVKSNMTLRLASDAILRAIPNALTNYKIVNLDTVDHVTVVGGAIEGERSAHQGTTGEWGMGLTVGASRHVVIDGVTVRECWGDGVYVTGASADVTMCNVISDHNRRQGMTITHVDGMVVTNCTFRNTAGTLPEAGIDIEPNPGETINNVTFSHCLFEGNAGDGFTGGVPIKNTGSATTTAVTLDTCEASKNGVNTLSTTPRSGIELSNSPGHTIKSSSSHDNVGDGIVLTNGANATTVTGNTVTHNGGSGIVEYLCMGNTITGNTVTDNTGHGIYSSSSTGSTISGNTVSGNGMTP